MYWVTNNPKTLSSCRRGYITSQDICFVYSNPSTTPLESALTTRTILYPDTPLDMTPISNFEDQEALHCLQCIWTSPSCCILSI